MQSNLAYGLTINERIEKMHKHNLDESIRKNQDAFRNWRRRPSLVNDELFQKILKSSGYSEEEYGLGVRQLSEEEKKH